MICGQCGDPLIKTNFIDAKRLLGIITALVFSTPLVIMIILCINEFSHRNLPDTSESVVLIKY